jgi:hypothetical protein
MMGAMTTLRNVLRRELTASASALGVLLMGLLGHAPAHAAWEMVPDLGLSAYSDKNPRLNPDTLVADEPTTTSAILDVAATIATFTETSFLTFRPRVTAYQYADEANSDLENEDLFLDSTGEYRWRTVTAGFRSNISRLRLLSSELADVDPDDDPDTEDPEDIDTGRLLFIEENRERVRFSPYLGFQVSERNTLRLAGHQHRRVLLGARHLDAHRLPGHAAIGRDLSHGRSAKLRCRNHVGRKLRSGRQSKRHRHR